MLRSLRPATRVLLVVTLLLAVAAAVLYLRPGQDTKPSTSVAVAGAAVQSGGAGTYPANTLPAIEAALAAGVTRLELQVVLTRDDIPVAYDSLSLDPDRTRDAGGAWLAAPVPLAELLADDLAVYDVGRSRAGSGAEAAEPGQRAVDGARVPRLSTALAFAERQSDGGALYALDVVRDPALPPSAELAAQAVAASLDAAKIGKRVTVQSFDWQFLMALHRLRPELPLVFRTSEQPGFDTVRRGADEPSPWLGGLDPAAVEGSLPRLVAQAGGTAWAPDYRDLRPVDLTEAHALGLQVVVWRVDDADTMASLLELGVDGIVTDHPDRLRDLLSARGKALPPAFPPKTP